MRIIYLSFILIHLFNFKVYADTVYLKNGRSIEGLIESEDEKGIRLNIGFGTVGFKKEEIDRIQRSSEEEKERLRKQWQLKIEAQRKTQQEKTTNPKQLEVLERFGHIFVNTILNKKVSAQLLLDTGASVIVLSYDIGRRLGIDRDSLGNLIKLQLADGRQINARYVTLQSVKVNGQEVEDVEAAVLLEDVKDIAFKDGVLGMSFLKRFNFKVDQANKKLILERLR